MTIETKCPGCGASYVLPARQEGKKVRCKACEETFTVKPISAKSAPAKKARDEEEVRVVAKARSREEVPRGRRLDEDADDRDAPRKARRRDEDDADDRDATPAKPAKKSSTLLYAVLGGIGALFLACCGGVGFWGYQSFKPPPEPTPADQVVECLDQLKSSSQFDQQAAANRLGLMEVVPEKRKDVVAALRPLSQSNGAAKEPAARALAHWALPEEMVTFCLRDLKSVSVEERRNAANQLASMPVHEPKRTDVAAVLGVAIHDTDGGVRAASIRALGIWGTAESIPTLIQSLNDKNPSGEQRQASMEALSKFGDKRAAAAVAAYLPDFFEHERARNALISMGPVAQSEVLKYYHHKEGHARSDAETILSSYGTSDDIILGQTIADLGSVENERQQNAANWLAKKPLDPKRQAEVAKALNGAMAVQDGNTRKAALSAIVVWGTEINVPEVCRYLKDVAFWDKQAAVDVLVKLKDPRGAEALVVMLKSFGPDRTTAAKGLVAMGTSAEPAVIKGLGSPDAGARIEACNVLQLIGTKESLPTLRVLFIQDPDAGVKLAAQNAFNAISNRGG